MNVFNEKNVVSAIIFLMGVLFLVSVSSAIVESGSDPGPYAAPQSGLWGFIDCSGKWVAPPIFRKQRDFFEGLAGVCEAEKCGFIDKEGRWVVPPQYDSTGRFSEGLAAVLLHGQYVFIDRSGHVVMEMHTQEPPCSFNEGLACFTPDVNAIRWGYIARDGQIAIEPKFHRARNFSEGLAAVQFFHGEAPEGGKLMESWGFIDSKGKVVIGSRFLNAFDFSEGFAAVETKNGWGYIDRHGSWRIRPQFDAADSFSEGLAVVTTKGLSGAIDRFGNMVIPSRFSVIIGFSGGLAAVGPDLSGNANYIDRSGHVALTIKGVEDGAGFNGPLALIFLKQGYRYVNRQGKTVWECSDLDPRMAACGLPKLAN